MQLKLLEDFARGLHKAHGSPRPAPNEDSLKAHVIAYVEAVAASKGLAGLTNRTEDHNSEHRVRPDIGFYIQSLLCGYIELKAVGKGADPRRFTVSHDRVQWERMRELPNLIYTDSCDWALFRHGEQVGATVRLTGIPHEGGVRAVSQESADKLSLLLHDFLMWEPQAPRNPTDLAQFIAPLTRFLRSEVLADLRLSGERSVIAALKAEWKRHFFPDTDDVQFSDAYAQTVTYAMLLARLLGARSLATHEAVGVLKRGNQLLAEALDIFTHDRAREVLRGGIDLLTRVLERVNPHELGESPDSLWLYFYEDFLAAYDSSLRNNYGVYYTPVEVVALQTRLTSELLALQFGKVLGFADDGVIFLDPAVGTGTYLVHAAQHALEQVSVAHGAGAVGPRAALMAANMYGFEVLVGPYAVAHLRLAQVFEAAGACLAGRRLQVFLADTLESPHKSPPGGLSLTHKTLTDEHEAARKVKNEGDILVCIGNPPYNRQRIQHGDESTKRKGGWVRYGDEIGGEGGTRTRPIFEDFIEPAKKAGAGGHLKTIYNDYVYFWRWALWRLFEQQKNGGIISFITASSYLRGPGFIGMREVMRKTFDDLWIIDLGGDNLGSRKNPNVFNIQIPVAIAIGVCSTKPNPKKPANVYYTKITGDSRDAKLTALDKIKNFKSINWTKAPHDWHAPFIPEEKGGFFDHPKLTDLLPWAHSGLQFTRTWPVGETEAILKTRFDILKTAPIEKRPALLKETRDRKITWQAKNSQTPPISQLTANSPTPKPTRYGYRSFDRQYALIDARLGDYLRPDLQNIWSEKQIYLATIFNNHFGHGAAMTATPYLPDLDHFRGSFGAKNTIPLYLDAAASKPNITAGLLARLEAEYATKISAEDLAAYIYAVLGNSAYVEKFWDELNTPGARVPLTRDATLFARGVKLGRKLLWYHTFGERMGTKRQDPLTGEARCTKTIRSDGDVYPEAYKYDGSERTIFVGTGAISPVAREIWEFEVSGLKIVQSWLGYRMRRRKGKKSSELDAIRPPSWTPEMTLELLRLIWILEATLAMQPALAALLDDIVSGDCFVCTALPIPTADERKPPKPATQATASKIL